MIMCHYLLDLTHFRDQGRNPYKVKYVYKLYFGLVFECWVSKFKHWKENIVEISASALSQIQRDHQFRSRCFPTPSNHPARAPISILKISNESHQANAAAFENRIPVRILTGIPRLFPPMQRGTDYLSLRPKPDFFNLWLRLRPPYFTAENFHLSRGFR